jgi:hypothetical protein
MVACSWAKGMYGKQDAAKNSATPEFLKNRWLSAH